MLVTHLSVTGLRKDSWVLFFIPMNLQNLLLLITDAHIYGQPLKFNILFSMIHVLPDDKFCVFDTFRENNANSQSPKGM